MVRAKCKAVSNARRLVELGRQIVNAHNRQFIPFSAYGSGGRSEYGRHIISGEVHACNIESIFRNVIGPYA